jgi:mannose-6-phosphate isomerase-like protein (cupin superfamily)
MSETIQKPWGSERILVNKTYCGKLLYINANHRTSLHYHMEKDEHFYVGKGILLMEYEKFQEEKAVICKMILTTGMDFHINPKQIHRMSAFTDVTLVEVSTFHDDKDTVRLEGGGEFVHDLGTTEDLIALDVLISQFPVPFDEVVGRPLDEIFLKQLKDARIRRRELLDKAEEKETSSER